MVARTSQTGVDQLLQLGLPSLLLRDLLLDGGDLDCELVSSLELGRIDSGGARWRWLARAARAAAWRRAAAYQIRGFAFDDELLLLKVLWGSQMRQYVLPREESACLDQCEHVVEVGTCRFAKVELCPPGWASDAP